MPAPPDPASPESAVPDPSVPESAGPESVSNPDSDGNGATCEETARLEQLAAATDLLRAVTDGIQQGTGELALQTQLRKDWPAPLVSAALALVEQRQRARRRFSRGDQMWFDRDLLEQATHEEVARYKAARFAGQEGPVWDLCCGAGSDAIALAEHHEVTAVDRSSAACFRTRANAAVYGVAGRITTRCADVTMLPEARGLVHIDPDRRPDGRRTLRIEQFQPGLDFLERLPDQFRGGAIKLSPACNFTGKFPEAEIELISYEGECREATVWFGDLGEPGLWRATALPSGETLFGNPLEVQAPMAEPGRWLCDPDPAIVRAGLVDLLADRTGLSRLDDAEEYLTGEEPVDSPFLTCLEIIAELPGSDKAIRRWFRDHPARDVEIRCRHLPVDAERVRRKLPKTGEEPQVLVFARVAGTARALVCRRPEA
ncbi:MAG: methyltransferase domain-containing protein [Planctomycetaceae bacterium]|nr:methyltransferase domain-containing protein [Planctomycetaceae bacterium]